MIETLKKDPRLAWGIGVGAFVLCLVQAARANLGNLNPDGIAYLRIAEYYARDEVPWGLAISGYWGPFLSWLMSLGFRMGWEWPVVSRVAMAIGGFLFWVSAVGLFRRFELSRKGLIVGSVIMGLGAVNWSVESVTPDLFLSAFLGFSVYFYWDPKWQKSWKPAVWCGVFLGMAYWCKSIALPFGMVLLGGFVWIKWHRGEGTAVVLLKRTGVSWAVMLGLALPWVGVLSKHYGFFTFSTSAKIAHAIVGPYDVERGHPFGRVFQVPEVGRLTIWEDPSRLEYAYWSPWESGAYFKHQVGLIFRNAQEAIIVWRFYDPMVSGIVFFFASLILWGRYGASPWKERWMTALWPVVLMIGLYLPVYFDYTQYRYFFPIIPFIFIASWGGGDWVCKVLSPYVRFVKKFIFPLMTLSFALFVLPRFQPVLVGLQDPAMELAKELAARMDRDGLGEGAIAGNASYYGGRTGLYLAFLKGWRWYGDESSPSVESILASGATYYVARPLDEAVGLMRQDFRFEDLNGSLYRDYPYGKVPQAVLFRVNRVTIPSFKSLESTP